MAKVLKLTEKQRIKKMRDQQIITLYRGMKGAKTAIYLEISSIIEPSVSASCVQKVVEKWEKGGRK